MALKKNAGSSNRLLGGTTAGPSNKFALPGWSQTQIQNGALLMGFFQNGGLSKAGAAGFVGNWFQESSLNPASSGGYLGQWGGARLAGLVSWAKQAGKPVTNIEVQVTFALHELSTSYPSLYKMLQNTNDPAAAALAISNQYERPAAWAANNANRVLRARQVFGVQGGVWGKQGLSPGDAAFTNPGGGTGFGSILDILNSPVDAIGGWLAQIALNLTKDAAVGIFDAIIVPFWHWNQRAVSAYTTQMFGTPGTATTEADWEMTLWNATFWGLGYWLLFADPTQKGLSLQALKPGQARKSRAARHARFVQSIPARRKLKKPKDVAAATATKPTPVVSYVQVQQVDTMTTHRPERVKVRTHGDTRGNRTGTGREPTRESASRTAGEKHPHKDTANTEPHASH